MKFIKSLFPMIAVVLALRRRRTRSSDRASSTTLHRAPMPFRQIDRARRCIRLRSQPATRSSPCTTSPTRCRSSRRTLSPYKRTGRSGPVCPSENPMTLSSASERAHATMARSTQAQRLQQRLWQPASPCGKFLSRSRTQATVANQYPPRSWRKTTTTNTLATLGTIRTERAASQPS